MKLRRLSTRDAGFEGELEALIRYEPAQDASVHDTVRRIVADVRTASQTLRATLLLGGTVKEPQVRN